jgi:hypothetical protein
MRRSSPSVHRRQPGELSTAEFLRGMLDAARAHLPADLQGLQARQFGSLVKLFDQDPGIHFELWLHHGRGRVELGLHFETRDPVRNQRLLEDMTDELPFLKHVLGESIEAEPWDKGWTRVYLTKPTRPPRHNRELVFSIATGEVLDGDRVRRAHYRYLRELGLPRVKPGELRHTHATHLLSQGADINLVAARLGHATPAFTLSVYGHLLPGADRAAVERLAGRFDHAAEPRPAEG